MNSTMAIDQYGQLLLEGVTRTIAVLEQPVKRISCTWCKQIFDERDMRTRRGLECCCFCDDKMREYEEDERRNAYERRHAPERDEDNGMEEKEDE